MLTGFSIRGRVKGRRVGHQGINFLARLVGRLSNLASQNCDSLLNCERDFVRVHHLLEVTVLTESVGDGFHK